LQGRKAQAALLAGHPCKAAGRRPPSLLAVELPSGAGPPAALLAGRPHHPPYPPARPAPPRQVIDLVFAPIDSPPTLPHLFPRISLPIQCFIKCETRTASHV